MIKELIEKSPNEYLDLFLDQYSKVRDFDKEKAKDIIKETKKFYKGDLNEGYAKQLEDRWYLSLDKNQPDYGVYSDKYYFTDIWCCWQMYSRNYVLTLKKSILKNNDKKLFDYLNNVNTIIDLGCGLGFTTALLSKLFPNAKVFGTNIKGTDQYKFCEQLSKSFNFKMIEENNMPKNIDLVFASEYFEHIEDVEQNIQKIIYEHKPKYLYLANSFNTRSVGHFTKYKFKGEESEVITDQKDISRSFNNLLRCWGYKDVKLNNWNNKPRLWEMHNEQKN